MFVDQPKNFFVPFVKPFDVKAFAVAYVWLLFAVVPVAPVAFALYVTVYVFAEQFIVLPLAVGVLYPALHVPL